MNISENNELSPGFFINTILNGLWQLSGGHGNIEPEKALKSMRDYHKAGLLTWDLADHYGFAEDLVGMFHREYNGDLKNLTDRPKFFTKWVPTPKNMTQRIVEKAIDRSLERMRMKSLDMLQFHWWDYNNENYLTALELLDELRKKGKIKHLSLTNFDTEHLKIINEYGIPIISNQIQFSVLDQRPLVKMVPYCQKNGIKILAYGTLGGGLFSSRFYKKTEPHYNELNTSSLQKYYGMIRRWGSWDKFQGLLKVLQDISEKYGVSIANVAVRYVLEQPAVAGTIIGARLSLSNHIDESLKVFSFSLDQNDHQKIQSVYDIGYDLFEKIGDCGAEYR